MVQTVFDRAKQQFKMAVDGGAEIPEGLAIQCADGFIVEGKSFAEIKDITQGKSFEIDAVVIATSLDTSTGNAVSPQPKTIRALQDFLRASTQTPPVFVVYGHSADDTVIQDITLAP